MVSVVVTGRILTRLQVLLLLVSLLIILVETRGLFTVDRCCITESSEFPKGESKSDCNNNDKKISNTRLVESLQLPPKFFRIKGYNGSLLVEHGAMQECAGGHWEDVRVTNITSSGKFPGKLDAFYGRDKLWFQEKSFERKQFCISRFSTEELTVKVCNRKCSAENPCVQRCCRFERVWNLSNLYKPSCIETEPENFWNSQSKNAPSYFVIETEKEQTSCSFYSSVRLPMEQFTYSVFRIGEDGSLWKKDRRRHWEPFLQKGDIGSHLCIENTVIFPWSGTDDDSKESYNSAVIIKLCQKPMVHEVSLESSKEEGMVAYNSSNLRTILLGSGLLFFSSFHVVTCLVYLGLGKDKEPVHRWTVVALTAFSALNFVLLGISKLSFLFIRRRKAFEYFTLCTFIGIAANFSFLTTLTWLSVANFDIWLTFRFLKPGGHSSRRLWMYTAIAFLIPGVIVGTGIALDLIYKDNLESEVIIPEFGLHSCTMEVEEAPWVFQYGPMAVALLLNVAFYVSTGLAVLKAKSQTTFARSSSTQQQSTYSATRDSFFLFVRLFLVMGIPWACEWISWVVTSQILQSRPPWYVDVFDMILVVQPALSFVILVLKKDVQKSLTSRYPWVSRLFCWNGQNNTICPRKGISLRLPKNLFHFTSSSDEQTKETEDIKVSQEQQLQNDMELK